MTSTPYVKSRSSWRASSSYLLASHVKSIVILIVLKFLIDSIRHDTTVTINTSDNYNKHTSVLFSILPVVSAYDSSIDGDDSLPDSSYVPDDNEDDPNSNNSPSRLASANNDGSPTSGVDDDESGGGGGGGGGALTQPVRHFRNPVSSSGGADNNDEIDYNTATTSSFQSPMAATRQPISYSFNNGAGGGPAAMQAAHYQHAPHHHHHMTPPAEMLNFFDSAFGAGNNAAGGDTGNGAGGIRDNGGDQSSVGNSPAGGGDISALDEMGVNGRHHQAAMNALFQRRQLSNHQLQAGQELNPLALGVPGSPQPTPFNMFGGGGGGVNPGGHPKQLASSNSLVDNGLGPSLPFGLGPGLAGIPGFHTPFDGPQRGDQSAHTNNIQSMSSTDSGGGGGGPSLTSSGAKVWPKIFRFTDGRINLSDFEKQKKIRLNSKQNNNHLENQIDSSPVMFDGRPLRRKSFLILHGGIY